MVSIDDHFAQVGKMVEAGVAPRLVYGEYSKFTPVIRKAIMACENSGVDTADHFARASEMVPIGSGAEREMDSYMFSRYASNTRTIVEGAE